ncbi:sensor histidine kinase [Actinoplanes sp. NPDC051513]|uniref:sensor histidine kinase n=1 Tax=Actinoplanes sp. NPDC051513 TaxID=3363908 RepID=UPI00379A3A51
MTPPARVRRAIDGLGRLVGGLGTAVLAICALVWVVIVALLCLTGVGLLLVPGALRAVRTVADRERGRLTRWGPEVIPPDPIPSGRLAGLRDPAVHRELGWLVVHATVGLVVGLFGLAVPLYAVQDLTFPLWWQLIPPEEGSPTLIFWAIRTWPDALAVALVGVAWLLVGLVALPWLARLQAWPGRRLLKASADVDLSLRVAQLTATRAAALDAHAVELRRIERSLHDGTQNRLVAVNVLLGAARRQLARDPSAADEILARAQDATEQALADLRSVARGILPPVLADRGLAGAIAGLAGASGVPCAVDVQMPGRCAASVEATAYFVVAEALTNVAKHSGASSAKVAARREGDRLVLRIDDDGHGGADESRGSGLVGIRRRVEAHDGRLSLTSPAGGPTTMRVELPCGS